MGKKEREGGAEKEEEKKGEEVEENFVEFCYNFKHLDL